ncbi:hypothetical protein J4573_04705 [Actinomadura barringtoniae]|uniref:Lipoprotein n=1 Tax=Actinomadura barringtoniae TaxID=1427535 RepID=A0A939T3B1_9ACTN|nr:hypothetical protein [Actinomadura barringtoniae]MBO2446379.1 hypothetical protein [Actinomadura barringtoniae]
MPSLSTNSIVIESFFIREFNLLRSLTILSLTLAATSLAGCGGSSDGKSTSGSPVSSGTIVARVSPSSPAQELVVYHDEAAGNDVTVAALRKVISQMPKSLSCDDLLKGGKLMGNTYPNGEALYLKVCNTVRRG